MDRLSSTESNVSATYGRRLNKSYYEPFMGFTYCIFVITIVDMQNKNLSKISKTKQERFNTCTDSYRYLSILQHFITSTVSSESTLFTKHTLPGDVDEGLELVHRRSSPVKVTKNIEQ